MKRARVLVVDDCRDTTSSLSFILRRWGYVTREVYTGSDAVRAAKTFVPDVAILDIGLPEMDGFAVATEMRRQRGPKKLLIVALTGFSHDEYRERSHEAGFDYYLVKPVEPEALKNLLFGA
jgi:DNA-binding response OmpR family regulator